MSLLRIAVATLIAFGLDRLSKIFIVHWLDLASVQVIEVQPPYLVFVMAWNKGINFGFLTDYGNRWALVAFSIALSLALTVWGRNKRGWILPLAIGLVVGGALGNAFDRVIYGAVADYLNMSCCGIANPYSFNVADSFIFCGMALMLIIGGETESRSRRRGRDEEDV